MGVVWPKSSSEAKNGMKEYDAAAYAQCYVAASAATTNK